MSQTFGRRAPPPAVGWRPEPPASPVVAKPTPAAETRDWRPAVDPEFAEWQAARRGTRWRTWGMAGLMVLGGPMSFFMPEGIGQWAGSEAAIAIQNGNLVLWVDGDPVIMVPDLIMNLELETGEPITTEMLRYGQRVAVIGLPVHDLMKTERALKVVGPKAFGYPDLLYSPLAASAA